MYLVSSLLKKNFKIANYVEDLFVLYAFYCYGSSTVRQEILYMCEEKSCKLVG
jgi:hypothetical protein